MRVITYGTYDLFHEGHRRLLERARALGDYLIVGVTTEAYDESRGKLNVRQSLMERVKNVLDSGLADEVIIEEYDGQKINDIQKHHVDIFAIGSDWLGKFDYLRDYCEVTYLERTKGVSSTQLRNEDAGTLRIGVVGAGRISHRFVDESRFVSGVEVTSVFSRSAETREGFAAQHELEKYASTYQELLDQVDAVYVATPHDSHYQYAREAILAKKHVLCEKPMTLSLAETQELFELAQEHDVVLMEAIKTAFAPGFARLIAVARSGSIGQIRAVDATFTKLESKNAREFDPAVGGGALSELASYPLLAIAKLLGTEDTSARCTSFIDQNGVDYFSRIELGYDHAIGTATVGLGVKSEGDLIVSGTRGYIYVPAPWWKTEYFELRFENPALNKRHYVKFDGDGLRYEIVEFYNLIHAGNHESFRLRRAESEWITQKIEGARSDAQRVSDS